MGVRQALAQWWERAIQRFENADAVQRVRLSRQREHIRAQQSERALLETRLQRLQVRLDACRTRARTEEQNAVKHAFADEAQAFVHMRERAIALVESDLLRAQLDLVRHQRFHLLQSLNDQRRVLVEMEVELEMEIDQHKGDAKTVLQVGDTDIQDARAEDSLAISDRAQLRQELDELVLRYRRSPTDSIQETGSKE